MTKRGGLRGHKTPQRIRSLRSKRAEFTYSPLYESVGLISIRLSCPPLPVIRCMASPSCVWASVNGACLQPDALGPVSLPPSPQSGPSCFQSRAPPRDASADGAYWQATLLHPGTRRITSAPSWGRVRGEEWPPSHRANGWSRLGEAAGCWTEVPTFKGMWHDAAQSVLGKSEHSAAC